jgi:GMP synthase (glutamine-hydrolysing)
VTGELSGNQLAHILDILRVPENGLDDHAVFFTGCEKPHTPFRRRPVLLLALAALHIDFSCPLRQGNLFVPPPKAAPISSSLRGSLLPFWGAKDMAHRVLVLQHTEWQPPGKLLVQSARDNRVALHCIKVWQETAADFAEYDGLIILGGPYQNDQEEQYPFLRDEKRLIRAWMNLNRPCLGFNLGQHLLAEAAGACIGTGYGPCIGFIEGHQTHQGKKHPLFLGVGSSFPLFKWHTRAIESPLPRNMVLLATSKDCMVEACCLEGRPHIIGLQGDNHVSAPEDVARLAAHDQEMGTAGRWGHVPVQLLLEQAAARAADLAPTFSLMMKNFFSLLRK